MRIIFTLLFMTTFAYANPTPSAYLGFDYGTEIVIQAIDPATINPNPTLLCSGSQTAGAEFLADCTTRTLRYSKTTACGQTSPQLLAFCEGQADIERMKNNYAAALRNCKESHCNSDNDNICLGNLPNMGQPICDNSQCVVPETCTGSKSIGIPQCTSILEYTTSFEDYDNTPPTCGVKCIYNIAISTSTACSVTGSCSDCN